MSVIKAVIWNDLTEKEQAELLMRPAVLAGADIAKIVDAYTKRLNVDHFAHVASLKEIEENNFNLNIPRYVYIPEAKQEIDLAATRAELKGIVNDKQAAIVKVDAMLAQLGL